MLDKILDIMTVTVHIDVSTKEGQKLIKELGKHTSIVVIDDPVHEGVDEIPQTYSSEYAENLLWEKLNDHYGIDIREI